MRNTFLSPSYCFRRFLVSLSNFLVWLIWNPHPHLYTRTYRDTHTKVGVVPTYMYRKVRTSDRVQLRWQSCSAYNKCIGAFSDFYNIIGIFYVQPLFMWSDASRIRLSKSNFFPPPLYIKKAGEKENLCIENCWIFSFHECSLILDSIGKVLESLGKSRAYFRQFSARIITREKRRYYALRNLINNVKWELFFDSSLEIVYIEQPIITAIGAHV